jgi:GT2 family glycosyltransferase
MEQNSGKKGLSAKALHIWKDQYHGHIPFRVLIRYMHKYIHERINIYKYGQRFFNPENNEEYNKWLSFQPKLSSDIGSVSVKIIAKSDFLNISNVKEKYVAVKDGNIVLYENISIFLEEEADLIYSDFDHINSDHLRFSPHCEPDFSYDTLRGFNYIGPFWIIKTDLLRKFNGQKWNPYRWLLELSDQKLKIRHISKILYGTEDQENNQTETVRNYFIDHNIKAVIHNNPDGITGTVEYGIIGTPLVSVIIPTKDAMDILQRTVNSIITKTKYSNYEIIIADNDSENAETIQYMENLQNEYVNIHICKVPGAFNYSHINNEAVRYSHGDYLVLMNNDIEILQDNWMKSMLGYAQRNWVGTVGAMLYYPDDTIQHAGVIAGKGGTFAHRYYQKDKRIKGYDHTLDVPNDVAGNTAACLMVSREKYNAVCGLDEKLSVQYNDADLCLKLYEKGSFNVFLPQVKMYHYESRSRGMDLSRQQVKRAEKENAYIRKKWYSYIKHDPFYNDQFDKNYDYQLIAGTGSN